MYPSSQEKSIISWRVTSWVDKDALPFSIAMGTHGTCSWGMQLTFYKTDYHSNEKKEENNYLDYERNQKSPPHTMPVGSVPSYHLWCKPVDKIYRSCFSSVTKTNFVTFKYNNDCSAFFLVLTLCPVSPFPGHWNISRPIIRPSKESHFTKFVRFLSSKSVQQEKNCSLSPHWVWWESASFIAVQLTNDKDCKLLLGLRIHGDGHRLDLGILGQDHLPPSLFRRPWSEAASVWITIYCEFRAISPRGRTLYCSLLEGQICTWNWSKNKISGIVDHSVDNFWVKCWSEFCLSWKEIKMSEWWSLFFYFIALKCFGVEHRALEITCWQALAFLA